MIIDACDALIDAQDVLLQGSSWEAAKKRMEREDAGRLAGKIRRRQ